MSSQFESSIIVRCPDARLLLLLEVARLFIITYYNHVCFAVDGNGLQISRLSHVCPQFQNGDND